MLYGGDPTQCYLLIPCHWFPFVNISLKLSGHSLLLGNPFKNKIISLRKIDISIVDYSNISQL